MVLIKETKLHRRLAIQFMPKCVIYLFLWSMKHTILLMHELDGVLPSRHP